MKRLAAFLVAAMASLAFVSSAQADNETAALSVDVTPRAKGGFFQAVPRPANLEVSARIDVPAGTPLVTPTKNIRVTFPRNVSMNPNNRVTPVCNALTQASNLSSPTEVMSLCPRSVVGTGNAILYAARNPLAVLDSPILVAFNAGVARNGNPKLKIWGYAEQTKYGILMETQLQKNGVMNIHVPPLSFDSAVKDFQLRFPGPVLDDSDLSGVVTRGRDANYIRSTCPARGGLTSRAQFVLQWINLETGNVMGPASTVNTAPYTSNCVGRPGQARLRVMRVAGPNVVRNGRVATFRVVVRNNGTGVARNVRVRTNRGGQGRGGNIRPGTAKAIPVRVRIRGNRVAVVRFIANSGKVRAAAVKRVRVVR